jgi:hypothetical protein
MNYSRPLTGSAETVRGVTLFTRPAVRLTDAADAIETSLGVLHSSVPPSGRCRTRLVLHVRALRELRFLCLGIHRGCSYQPSNGDTGWTRRPLPPNRRWCPSWVRRTVSHREQCHASSLQGGPPGQHDLTRLSQVIVNEADADRAPQRQVPGDAPGGTLSSWPEPSRRFSCT